MNKQVKLVEDLVMFSKRTGCAYCNSTKMILASHGIEATQVYVEDNSDIREMFKKSHDTVPQVYFKGNYIGDSEAIRMMSLMGDINMIIPGGYFDE